MIIPFGFAKATGPPIGLLAGGAPLVLAFVFVFKKLFKRRAGLHDTAVTIGLGHKGLREFGRIKSGKGLRQAENPREGDSTASTSYCSFGLGALGSLVASASFR